MTEVPQRKEIEFSLQNLDELAQFIFKPSYFSVEIGFDQNQLDEFNSKGSESFKDILQAAKNNEITVEPNHEINCFLCNEVKNPKKRPRETDENDDESSQNYKIPQIIDLDKFKIELNKMQMKRWEDVDVCMSYIKKYGSIHFQDLLSQLTFDEEHQLTSLIGYNWDILMQKCLLSHRRELLKEDNKISYKQKLFQK